MQLLITLSWLHSVCSYIHLRIARILLSVDNPFGTLISVVICGCLSLIIHYLLFFNIYTRYHMLRYFDNISSIKNIQIFLHLFQQHRISFVDLFSAYQIHGNNLINLTAVRWQFSQYPEHSSF